MKRITNIVIVFSLFMFAGCIAFAQKSHLPHLERRGGTSQLIVKGKPFLVLGGELRNSTASSPEYMKDIWPAFKGSGLNTVLAVVSWDQIEPEEGKFDFTQLDAMLRDARKNDLKIVILWFGSFKNGGSGYIPGWVGANYKRFPRAVTADGLSVPSLSVFYDNNWEADKKAYVAMMEHIREVDSEDNTVLFIQIENEMGLFFDRDYSGKAEKLLRSQVPEELINFLVTNKKTLLPETVELWSNSNYATKGSWEEIFGRNVTTSEFFMAWYYATYTNEISKAGKDVYPIPTYVNVALQHAGDIVPGDYPSGGPVAQVHDVWRAGAPSVDFYAPDIYDAEYSEILDRYARRQTAIFVPESGSSAANAVYLIGEHRGIGFSPFGIDGGIKNHQTSNFFDAYRMMASFSEIITEHQAKGTIRAAWLSELNPEITNQEFVLGNHKVIVDLVKPWRLGAQPETNTGGIFGPRGQKGYAMVLLMDDYEYLVMGANAQVTFAPADGDGITAFRKVREGYFKNGEWHPLRWMNGDETNVSQDLDQMALKGQSGYGLLFRGETPGLQRVWLYNFK
jgi:beta-galactosidase GanA